MELDFNGEKPIFQQIAEGLEDGILSGAFPEEGQIPSITEFSVLYKINPATALKGINLLVEEGVVYKKRGVGMFVAQGAAERLRVKRKEGFTTALWPAWWQRPSGWELARRSWKPSSPGALPSRKRRIYEHRHRKPIQKLRPGAGPAKRQLHLGAGETLRPAGPQRRGKVHAAQRGDTAPVPRRGQHHRGRRAHRGQRPGPLQDVPDERKSSTTRKPCG